MYILTSLFFFLLISQSVPARLLPTNQGNASSLPPINTYSLGKHLLGVIVFGGKININANACILVYHGLCVAFS